MRLQNIILKKAKIYGYLPILIISVLISCKTEQQELVKNSNLQISLKGIEDYVEVDYTTKQSSTTKNSNNTPTAIHSYAGFDAITSIHIAEPLDGNEVTKEATIIKKYAATDTSKLENTVKYRLIFYRTSNNTIAADQEIKVGDAPNIQLDAGIAYKWIAYSINQATVPAITNNVINKTDIANKDLLYATGNLTMQYGENYLNITFKRYTTQYVVNVDIRGMFATFHDNTRVSISNGNIDLFKTADFNILTGEFQGTPESIKINGTDLKAITAGINDKKSATFYSIISSESALKDALKLNFTPLSIVMDPENEHPTGLLREFAATSVDLKHEALSVPSTRGRRYIINAMLVESAIKVGTATTEWARSNLWYSANNITGAYRFRVSPHQRDISKDSEGYISDEKDLWKFNTTTPDGTSQTNGFDPCRSVYPNNLWKLPSQIDFENLSPLTDIYLVNRNDLKTGLEANLIIGLVQVYTETRVELLAKWAKSASSNANNAYSIPYLTNETLSTMNDLFLPAIGYRANDKTITNRPTLTEVLSVSALEILGLNISNGLVGNGYYWTSKDISKDDTVLLPTYYTYRYNSNTLASINLLGLNLLSVLPSNSFTSNFSTMSWENSMNIRCVRNNSYPNEPTY
ncbi:hypothetical protein [Sphingobacterium rhinopitheci]|uniref:hypothetical protein n=1 Tax=Sphingobacterium rhinopitheci TaxID=2781960 RepID=UPI001F525B63|nr:hypothetical protein [Sphingobacterium rhinopitheci]MCI0921811.1 hypothetical protein [Sphingobacterium rhinopitheci]